MPIPLLLVPVTYSLGTLVLSIIASAAGGAALGGGGYVLINHIINRVNEISKAHQMSLDKEQTITKERKQEATQALTTQVDALINATITNQNTALAVHDSANALHAQTDEIKQTQIELFAQEKFIEHLSSELNHTQLNANQLIQSNELLIEQQKSTVFAIESQNLTISELQNKLNELKEQITSQESLAQTINKVLLERNELTILNDRYKTKIATLQNELHLHEQNQDAITSMMQKKEHLTVTFEQKIIALTDNIYKKNQEIDALKQKNKHLLTSLTEKIQQLETAINQQIQEKEYLKHLVKDEQEHSSHLKMKLEEIISINIKVTDQLKLSEEELSVLKPQIPLMQNQITFFSHVITTLREKEPLSFNSEPTCSLSQDNINSKQI